MDKSEYWLLDSVIEGRCPLFWLVSRNVAETFNKRHHGLERQELVNVLNRLFQGGDLVAKRMEKSVSKGFFVPTQTEIEDALSRRLDCFYGLTSQGGARWEEVSQPRWERYISSWVTMDPDEGETVATTRELVEEYDSKCDSDILVIPGSRRWDVLRPWQATYWKELPVGHRLRFKYELVERTSVSAVDPEYWQWFKEIHKWYTPYTGS